MANFPNTRISLILRLAHAEAVQAWQEFSEIYAPLLYRLAIAKGLQRADAEDVTQDILFAVARAAERFQPAASRAKFRTWLARIARNLIADFYAGRAKRPVSQAMSDSWLQAVERPSEKQPGLDSTFGLEQRRAIFHLAARRVRSRVAESSWQAFELTAVQQISAEQTAEHLKLALGNVYVARCRVMKLLRDEVQALEARYWESSMDGEQQAWAGATSSPPEQSLISEASSGMDREWPSCQGEQS